jgi:hypothetical protein
MCEVIRPLAGRANKQMLASRQQRALSDRHQMGAESYFTFYYIT